VIDAGGGANPSIQFPRAVLVDLDDTLIDGSAVVDCWGVACECCAPVVDPQVVLAEILKLREWYWSDAERHRQGRLNMSAARQYIAQTALDHVGCDVPGLADRIARGYDRCRDDRTVLFPEVVNVLTWLRGSGCRLALVTNGAAEMQRQKIERFGLEPLFDAILVEGEVGFGKPDERIYELALARLAASPHHTWMIGDNLEWDVEQPQKLGITAIWVDSTGTGVPPSRAVRPDLIVRRFTDLREHAGRLSAGRA
jgi:putative hydrolase of the HAD superfamily